MTASVSDFRHWLERAQHSPERIVYQFFAKHQMMTPEMQRATLASYPDRAVLLKTFKESLSQENASLRGIPYVLQDLFDVRGLPTCCGAPFSGPFEGPLDESSLLVKALDQLGATCFAKTVPSEFGYDLKGHNPTFGDCPHGDGLRWVCGGGGGSAVRSVYDGLVPLAFGLDSCGGMRLPIALHGLFGFRMGKNDLAREGAFAIVPSLESVGFCTSSLEDLLSTFTALYKIKERAVLEAPRGYVYQGPSTIDGSEVEQGILQFSRELLINHDPAINSMFCKTFAHAAQALNWIEARELHSVHQYWVDEYRQDYATDLLQLIERGADCTQMEMEVSLETQNRIRTVFSQFFETHDFLIIPICPVPNPEKNQWSQSLHDAIRQLIAPVSLAMLPSIILPIPTSIGRHTAVQIVLHPNKLYIVPELIEQIAEYYGN